MFTLLLYLYFFFYYIRFPCYTIFFGLVFFYTPDHDILREYANHILYPSTHSTILSLVS